MEFSQRSLRVLTEIGFLAEIWILELGKQGMEFTTQNSAFVKEI